MIDKIIDFIDNSTKKLEQIIYATLPILITAVVVFNFVRFFGGF